MGNTAIVILNYNGVDYLRQFLPKVILYADGCKVVVIDNHSNDGSAAYINHYHPDIQFINLPENYGFSGGYNQGLTQVVADNYVLLNSDVEVTEGWITKLLEYMGQHPEVAACQPKILSFHQKNVFDYAGAAGGFVDVLGYPFCRGRMFNHLEQDHGQYDTDQKIFWASGACFFIRADIFHDLGGLDQDFFAHMEEIDLCWRIQRAGYEVAYVSDSQVFHLGGGTLKDTNPLKTYLNFRNGLQLLVKNSSIQNLLWKLPIRMLLDIVAGLRFLLMGSFAHFMAVIKGNIVFLLTFLKTWKKRNKIKLPYNQDLYPKLIVWEYFLKGKKTYSKLTDASTD